MPVLTFRVQDVTSLLFIVSDAVIVELMFTCTRTAV